MTFNSGIHHGIAIFLLTAMPCAVACGDLFAPAAGQTNSTAIAANDASITGWASTVESYTPGSNVDAQWQDTSKALNAAGNSNGANDGFVYDIVSLGRGGQITLTFDAPIRDGAGCDFAVFENSFSDNFLELAWVEVSSNGSDFHRFAHYSFTANSVSPFAATMNPTDVGGFAGKYRGGYGTPFDLDNLPDHPSLDKNNITHIRLVDVIGDGLATDSLNNIIYDPYPTSDSAGFDLDAVAVMHFTATQQHNVPLSPLATLLLAALLMYTFSVSHQKRALN